MMQRHLIVDRGNSLVPSMRATADVDEMNHLFWVSLFSIAFANMNVDSTLFFLRGPLPPTAKAGRGVNKSQSGLQGLGSRTKKNAGGKSRALPDFWRFRLRRSQL
jgi:hypothetical protein